MEILFTVIGLIGFLFRITHKLAGLAFLWWRKEYRFDRMLIHLRTRQGMQLLWGKTQLGFAVLALMWFVMPLRGLAETAIAAYAFAVGVAYARRIGAWLLPPVSPKVAVLLLTSLAAISALLVWSPTPPVVTLAVADVVLFAFTALVVLLVSIPTRVYHWWVIGRAVAVLRKLPPHQVVGVTGSYGKTSVKEYLTAILSSRYKTAKTEASKNSPIGIAETVLAHPVKGTEVFVVEMGAYKKGEISFMAGMVRPEIGIVTAINPQHQDLFGSIDVTMQAKYELLRGLSGRRIAIVNLDDERTRRMGQWAKKDGCEVWGYATKPVDGDVPFVTRIFRAANVKSDTGGVSFECSVDGQKIPVKAAVLGKHQAGNITAAIAAATACGMTPAEIAKAVSRIRAAHKVMEVVKSDGPVYINDTFNNNPDAAKAAIDFLSSLPGKRILVFQPMVELGSFAESSHEEVGAYAAERVDAILLTNANNYDAFERGVRAVSKTLPLTVATPQQAAAYIRKHAGKMDCVLFKGKDAEHALKLVT